MQFLKLYFLLFFISIACSPKDSRETTVHEEYTVAETAEFLSAETDDFVGRPIRIKAYHNGLYFSDEGYHRIAKVDSEGNKLFSFGSHGRGPGEFESLAGFWTFDDEYLVYDYNGFKFITYDQEGRLVEEAVVEKNPVNPDGFPANIPITVHAISTYELLIPSRGRNGSLFAIADIKTGNLEFAGKAVGEHVESYDSDEVQRAYSNGEIPAIFVNMVAMASSSSAIYSFQQTTGMLEKYSHSGELIWDKHLNIPAQAELFERISEYNRQSDQGNEPYHFFNYAWSLAANEKVVAVLLNMPEDLPVTVAWIPADGSELHMVAFPGLSREVFRFFGTFSVSPDKSRFYFLNIPDGIIYEAEWPRGGPD